jgi:hypothetical protein
MTAPTKAPGRRIVGAERALLGKAYVVRYVSGESIRELAASTGRSYGFVQAVLLDSGGRLRARGDSWASRRRGRARRAAALIAESV